MYRSVALWVCLKFHHISIHTLNSLLSGLFYHHIDVGLGVELRNWGPGIRGNLQIIVLTKFTPMMIVS